MKKTISKKQLREFGILIGSGFPLLIGWILPAMTGHQSREWTLCVGIPLLLVGITAPIYLYYPYKCWMALGHTLGWINSRIILGLIFIVVLQPISYIMRIFGYDPLKTRRKGEITYRENIQNKQTDLTRIF